MDMTCDDQHSLEASHPPARLLAAAHARRLSRSAPRFARCDPHRRRSRFCSGRRSRCSRRRRARVPPFELAALTFAIGGAFGLAYAAARGRLGALLQPWPVWLVGVGGLVRLSRPLLRRRCAGAAGRGEPDRLSLAAADRALLSAAAGRAACAGAMSSARRSVLPARSCCSSASPAGVRSPGGGRRSWLCAGARLRLRLVDLFGAVAPASRRCRPKAVAGFCLATAAAGARSAISPSRRRSGPATPVSGSPCSGSGSARSASPSIVWDFGVKHGDIRLLGVACLRRAGALDDHSCRHGLRAGDAVAGAGLRDDRRRRFGRFVRAGAGEGARLKKKAGEGRPRSRATAARGQASVAVLGFKTCLPRYMPLFRSM